MEPKLALQTNPGFWSKTSWIQLGYGLWANLSMMGIAMALEFPAVAIPQLIKPESKIHPSISEESWIASVLVLSSIIGCILSGYIMDECGRRLVMLLCQLPMCIGWLYMSFAQTPIAIIIGRIITGIGFGMTFSAPRVYGAEIALPNMRGVVGAFPNIALSLGITLQAGLGSFLEWHVLCYICSAISIALMISNYFLPETPYFMLMKGTRENAKINLRKFRSAQHDIDAEMDSLQAFKLSNNIRSLPPKELLKALFSGSSCKPFGIICGYLLFMQLSGVSIMIMWTIDIMEGSKSTVDAHFGNFLLGITRIIIAIVTSILLFKIGRKIMGLISALGLGVVCVILSLYIYYAVTPTVFPQLCFMAFTSFATLGYYNLPFLVMCELYPLQVRGLLSGISVSICNVLIFGTNFSYPFIKDELGLANTILGFGIVSILGFIYLFFYLPETKNLTLQEIEQLFKKRRPAQSRASSSTSAGVMKSNEIISWEDGASSKTDDTKSTEPHKDDKNVNDSTTPRK